MEEKEGIKELKELVEFIGALGSAVDKSTKDGLDVADIASFIGPMMLAPEAFSGIDKAKLEIKDLSDEEMKQLVVAFSEKLDLVDDSLEATVEKALSVIVFLYGVIEDIKKLKEISKA